MSTYATRLAREKGNHGYDERIADMQQNWGLPTRTRRQQCRMSQEGDAVVELEFKEQSASGMVVASAQWLHNARSITVIMHLLCGKRTISCALWF
jgi:hypothetical protein